MTDTERDAIRDLLEHARQNVGRAIEHLDDEPGYAGVTAWLAREELTMAGDALKGAWGPGGRAT